MASVRLVGLNELVGSPVLNAQYKFKNIKKNIKYISLFRKKFKADFIGIYLLYFSRNDSAILTDFLFFSIVSGDISSSKLKVS